MSIVDNFPYSNGALSGQAAWATTAYDGTMTVSSNTAIGTNGNTRLNIRTDTWNTNQSSTITLGTMQSSFPIVVVQGSNDGGGLDGYSFGIDINSGGVSSNWFLERTLNGATDDTLATGSDATIGSGDTIGIAIDGDDVVAYLNGVEVAREADTTFRSGKPAFGTYTENTAIITQWVGTGESGGGSSVTGTGALTLPAVTAAGTGTKNGAPTAITGTGAATLPQFTVAGVASRGIHDSPGPIALTLPAITASGTGTKNAAGGITGSGALTLPIITVSGTGTKTVGPVAITGTGALTLGRITVFGTNVPYDPDSGFIGGTAVSPEGVMQTLSLGDGVPVPAGAVFINGIAHSSLGQRYVAPWPASGIVGYSQGRAVRPDGAQCVISSAPTVYLAGFGYTNRGELCVTLTSSSNFVQGISVTNGRTAVSQV